MKIKASGNSVLIKLSKKEAQIDWDSVEEVKNFDTITHIEVLAKEALVTPKLENFSSLKNLTLSCTQLSEIEHIEKVILERLKISGSDLEKIPEVSFENLIGLSIPRNKILSTKLNVNSPMPLEQLDLGQNKLTQLEVNFNFFPKLKRLNLEHNQLTSLPEELYELKELSHLALKGNPLDEETQQKLYDSFKIVFEN
jgi:Leucine-rich repeat (LRR) protein